MAQHSTYLDSCSKVMHHSRALRNSASLMATSGLPTSLSLFHFFPFFFSFFFFKSRMTS